MRKIIKICIYRTHTKLQSSVLKNACTVLVGKVQGAFRVHPVESLLVDGMYKADRK